MGERMIIVKYPPIKGKTIKKMILVVIQIAQYNNEFNADLNQLRFSPFAPK